MPRCLSETGNCTRIVPLTLLFVSIFIAAGPGGAFAGAMDDRFLIIIKRFVATANDGTIVALKLGSDDEVGIWKLASERSERFLRAHGKINSLDVSPEGQLVVTGDDHNDAIVWDARSGNRIAVLPHPKRVTSVAFMLDGERVVTGCGDGVTRLWHSRGGPPIWVYPKKLAFGEVLSVIASSSNELIVTTGGMSTVLDQFGNSAGLSFPGGQLMAFSEDSLQAFGVSSGVWPESWSIVSVVDAKSRKVIWRYRPPEGGLAIGLAVSPKGNLGVSASGNPFYAKCAIVLWDSQDRQTQAKVVKVLEGQEECIPNFAFSKDGKTVIGRKSGSLVVWDVETGKRIRTLRN